VTILGFVIGLSVLVVGWWGYRRYVLKTSSEIAPKWKAASLRQRLPFWRRTSGQRQKDYELVNRHEV